MPDRRLGQGATGPDENARAWKVITNCGKCDYHPLAFSEQMEIGAMDKFGNHTPRMSAENGKLFHVTLTETGHKLSHKGSTTKSDEVQLQNDLAEGAIDANIYKVGKLLATRIAIAPGQNSTFQFQPTLWVGVIPTAVEGKVMGSAIISNVNTEFLLLGIVSADIVMTGGGHCAVPFKFTLENVVMA